MVQEQQPYIYNNICRFEVLTCSCVGDDDYLKKQFDMLEIKNHPTILKKTKKYHFGKLY